MSRRPLSVLVSSGLLVGGLVLSGCSFQMPVMVDGAYVASPPPAWSKVEPQVPALEPVIAEARRTYPLARGRFLAGLPEGQRFFVTTRLRDASDLFEQVFIAVERIEGGEIQGVISNEINTVKGYHRGQPYRFPEGEVIDWTIAHRDGSEEGNRLGKYLERTSVAAPSASAGGADGGPSLPALVARIQEVMPSRKTGTAAAITLLTEDTQKRISLPFFSEDGVDVTSRGAQLVLAHGERGGWLLIMANPGQLRVGHHECSGKTFAIGLTLTENVDIKDKDMAWTVNQGGSCAIDIWEGKRPGDLQGKLSAKVVLNGRDTYYNIEAGYFYMKGSTASRRPSQQLLISPEGSGLRR
jgi:hypothetical protein